MQEFHEERLLFFEPLTRETGLVQWRETFDRIARLQHSVDKLNCNPYSLRQTSSLAIHSDVIVGSVEETIETLSIPTLIMLAKLPRLCHNWHQV